MLDLFRDKVMNSLGLFSVCFSSNFLLAATGNAAYLAVSVPLTALSLALAVNTVKKDWKTR